MSTDLNMISRHSPNAVGYTQASRVIPVVKSRDAESLMVTMAATPSNCNALPNRPELVHAAPLIVPELPLPDLSAALRPLPSSKPSAATRPLEGLMTFMVKLVERELLVPSETVKYAT